MRHPLPEQRIKGDPRRPDEQFLCGIGWYMRFFPVDEGPPSQADQLFCRGHLLLGCRELNAVSRSRLIFAALMEPVIRFISLGASAFSQRDVEGVESVIRGWLIGGRSSWRIGRSVRIVGPAGRVRFGRRVTLFGHSYLNCNGPEGFIEIGRDSHIDVGCVLYGQGGLSIGNHCAIAAGVIIYSQTNADDFRDGTPVSCQPVRYQRVIVEDGCWLGAGVRVIPDVTIGQSSQVGAGAVVTRSLPPLTRSVGVPARVIGYLE